MHGGSPPRRPVPWSSDARTVALAMRSSSSEAAPVMMPQMPTRCSCAISSWMAYGDDIAAAERSAIPSGDLPLGAPAWWSPLKTWARREGADANEKRATLVVRVPNGERPWE